MSSKNTEVPVEGTNPESLRERTLAPPIVQMNEDDLRDVALGPLEGSITLLWAREDTAILEAFDEALATGSMEPEVQERIEGMIDAENETPASHRSRAVADLLYHGREVASDLALTDADPFGVALVPYEGGDLDASEFEIRQRVATPEANYEYRVIVAPPTLDDAEADAMEYGPSDTDGAVLVTEPAKASAALALAFAAGVLAGAAVAGSGTADLGVDQLDESATGKPTMGASVDELIESRREALE